MAERATRRRSQNRSTYQRRAAPAAAAPSLRQYRGTGGSRKICCCRRCLLYASGVVISFVMAGLIHFYFFDGPIKSVKYRLPKPQQLDGALKVNQELTKANILLPDKIYGPESIAVHRKSKIIYASLRTGHIAKIKIDGSKKAELVGGLKLMETEAEEDCDGSYRSFQKCGRPLGLRFHRKNADLLLVADAYFGLFEVDIRNATVRPILKSGTKIKRDPLSRPVVHFNDFDISESGRHIVLSEPSQRFADCDCLYALAEHRPDGRLLHYDVQKAELSVLIDGLQYPNGVQFDSTEKCVLFSEMGNLRILRHCFDYGYGKYTIVTNNLPGYPDNIRISSSTGMLWVPLGEARLEDDSWITERPWLRDLVAMIASPQSFSMLIDYLSPRYGLLLLVDPVNGTILRSFHDPSGKTISSISQATELDDGTVLLGGDQNRFLASFKPSLEL